jgi:hypothetical protein
MNRNRFPIVLLTCLTGLSALVQPRASDAAIDSPGIVSISSSGTVVASWQGKQAALQKGQSIGQWVLMAVAEPGPHRRLAVFEDFSQTNGHLLYSPMRRA